MPKQFLVLFLVVFISVTRQSIGQITFNELPNYSIKTVDSAFFDITSTRKIIPLDGQWNVYTDNEKDTKKYSVTVPSIFKGEGDLIFERKFPISKDDLTRFNAKLVFFGINYTADISLNNVIIYRHPGGEYPFDVALPKDILSADKDNTIT
ncbi:MAG: hypothetical protein K8H86_10485, partial [Ignavibacteriaceae bacterium]|nr:hypothetical protein [Ignavibacteriaceae bacterium]